LFKDINKTSEYISAERKIKKNNELMDLSVAFLSSYTSETINPYLRVELAKLGYLASVYFAPYKQVEQEVLNVNSGLYLSNPNVIIIHNRIEDMYYDLTYRFISYSQDELNSIFDSIIHRFSMILDNIRNNTNAKIIIINFANTQDSIYSFPCSPSINAKYDFIYKINAKLSSLCENFLPCNIINYSYFVANIGVSNFTDQKLNYLARIPFSNNVQIELGKTISRVIYAFLNTPKKCIVLDLDNTLWGGIVGEDGISGIQLGEEYPGNVFRDFQRSLLGLRDQGVLLAIASKNNSSDALSVFENHSACILSKEDFSAIEISWNDKAKSIKSISTDLNIGLESIVFFDDSPFERQWVREQLPEVNVIDTPSSPMEYTDSLFKSGFFDNFIITGEDTNRAELYKQEKKRRRFKKSNTVEDFLNDLRIKVIINEVDETSISRFEQLLNKTNQFNMTTRRYSAADVINITESGGMAFYLSARDRFGDNGISGACILRKIDDNDWIIDTFLLSCRVIGRKIEIAFIYFVINNIKNIGGRDLYGEYIPTKKNSFVSDFYGDLGFISCVKNNKKYWKLSLSKAKVKCPSFIKIIDGKNDR